MPARRVLVALSLGLALPLLTADPAAAHTVTGVQPTNFRSEIISVEPPTPGVAIHLLDLGRRVEVVDDGPGEVVLLGYQGEPYLRVGPAGVFENRRSPAVYLNRPTSSGATPATPPAGVDAAAPPSWHRLSGGHTVRWRDRRTRWEGATPTEVTRDRSRRHVVTPRWTIALQQGGRPITVTGQIVWVPPPDSVPWLLVALVLLGAAAAVGLTRRWGPPLAAALAVLVAIDVVHSFATAAASNDAVLVEVGRVVVSGLFATVAWVAAAFAIGPLAEEHEGGALAGAMAAFVIALYSGVGDTATLTRSQVPFVFSAGVARAAVATSLGLGLGIPAAVALVIRREARRGITPA